MRISLTARMKYYILVATIFLIVSLVAIPLLIILRCPPMETTNILISLSVEISGIAITILVLMFAIEWREYNQWSVVKDEVYLHIQNTLSRIFDSILTYVENGYEFKKSLFKEFFPPTKENENARKKQVYMKLCELKDMRKIQLNTKMLSIFLEDRTFVESFLELSQRLSNIESKYSRFLSPQTTLSLMKLQVNIRSLEHDFSLHKSLKITPSDKEELEQVDRVISDLISVSFKFLVEELHKLHEGGIEFPYP